MSRRARIVRETGEVKVEVSLELEGRGLYRGSTGIPFFDHILEAFSKFSRFNITIEVEEYKHVDDHHVIEDVAIALGTALSHALGERLGIKRFAHAMVPMDDALAVVAVDLGGRAYSKVTLSTVRECIGGLAVENVEHFVRTLCNAARITVHARVSSGINDHHKIEALFKALGVALGDSARIISEDPPSTKGVI